MIAKSPFCRTPLGSVMTAVKFGLALNIVPSLRSKSVGLNVPVKVAIVTRSPAGSWGPEYDKPPGSVLQNPGPKTMGGPLTKSTVKVKFEKEIVLVTGQEGSP